MTQTIRGSEELLLGKREPLNLDAAFGELMTASAEDRSERDSGKCESLICTVYYIIVIIIKVFILIHSYTIVVLLLSAMILNIFL